jgi:murein DD-endopeptidase MepM/ murein hydrolase activator NlpD
VALPAEESTEEAATLDAPEESDESTAESVEEDPAELTDISLEDIQDFTAFEDSDTMLWPVLGEIVMDFSTDALVYDKTLEQYRTNDSVCISAPSGTQVRSAAEGLVVAIETSKEFGNTVVVEHGNGWVTTYSQLQDNILVSVGDVVESGQIIGGVGEPSIYSALLGSHLNFIVSKDDVPVNPNDILASN